MDQFDPYFSVMWTGHFAAAHFVVTRLCLSSPLGNANNHKTVLKTCIFYEYYQGPVVQSVVSLTCSLRVISLTVLADLIYNILKFLLKKCAHIFSAKNFSIFAYHLM